jgi:hypothetical protein
VARRAVKGVAALVPAGRTTVAAPIQRAIVHAAGGSSKRAIDRAVVLQLCTLLWAGGAFAREAGGRHASAKAVAGRKAVPKLE